MYPCSLVIAAAVAAGALGVAGSAPLAPAAGFQLAPPTPSSPGPGGGGGTGGTAAGGSDTESKGATRATEPGFIPRPGASSVFQAEPEILPKLTVSWPRKDGTTAVYHGERAYTAPEQRAALAPNLTTYVALGGTRGAAGAADPRAAIVKVGFYKVNANLEFFENIADGASITVELTNVKFNRPPRPEPETGVQHGKYEDPNSVLGCTTSQAVSTAMGGLDFYNTVDPKDDLAGKVTPKNGRLGSLAGKMAAKVEANGTMTMTVTLPYAGLKHPDDPWLRTNPGDFAEPFHFHVEMEVLPVDAGARQQGTAPAKAQKPA